ncbi:MAG: 4Fe-4S dicluster domain-containing protein, partial [Candidatus Thorarchaeota archaeon]
MFDVEECTRCGICLERCPVIDLDIDQAKQEIKNLISGSSFIVDRCATCGTCDLNCPIGLTPMDLIKELKSVQIKESVEQGKVPY